MNPNIFFLALCFGGLLGFLLIPLISGRRPTKLRLATVFSLLFLVAVIAGLTSPDQNPIIQLITLRSLSDRASMITSIAALMLGLLFASSVSKEKASRMQKAFHGFLFGTAALSVLSIAMRDIISPYLANPKDGDVKSARVNAEVSNWQLQQIINHSVAPTAICIAPNGLAYVCGYSGAYGQNGSVIRLQYLDKSDTQTVASGLTRPHGIAWHEGDLFVSRAGQYTTAKDGLLTQVPTGAITRLSDVDQDGIFDFYHDIVSDLPGARLPDGLHQNNGIAFDSKGSLYITVGNGTNAAPPKHKLEGTILRTNRNGEELEIFARGLRNPFGICVTNNDEVYCTDNDPNITERGDELNLIEQGKHYGHPYDVANGISLVNSVEPVVRLNSAQGIAAIPTQFQKQMSGDLLIADYADGSIKVFNSENRSIYSFQKVPSAVAVTMSKNGTVLACSYGDKSTYVYTLEER